MENIPSLEDLLNYGEEYQYPDLIMSDYFRVDNTRKKENKNKQNPNEQTQDQSLEQPTDEQSQDQSLEQQTNEQSQDQSLEQPTDEQSQDQSLEQQTDEQAQEQSLEQRTDEQSQEQSLEQRTDEQSQEQNFEQPTDEQTQEQNFEQPTDEQSQEQNFEQPTDERSPEQNFEQPTDEESPEHSSEQPTDEQTQDQNFEQSTDEQSQEQNFEQPTDEQSPEQNSEQPTDEQTQEQNFEQPTDEESPEQNFEQSTDEQSQEQNSEQQAEENDFDDLLDNYDENNRQEWEDKEQKENHSASDKLNDITTTKIYKVLKKLVSLSYERFQRGTYKYDKKAIVKHYLTNQKFKIIDDLVSPTFKPDVYVFDLSPSNNESLEMYVNAISSVAIKNSLIYLTYNDCILRKLLIKKQNAKNIDVNKIVNSEIKSYNNFECTIFSEYRSLYEELKDIKDREIYIFSDFDISIDISRLSQENPNIVWFSTEKDYGFNSFFYREYPSSYMGYYVETSGIEDIEKFIREKNKSKYKGRFT